MTKNMNSELSKWDVLKIAIGAPVAGILTVIGFIFVAIMLYFTDNSDPIYLSKKYHDSNLKLLAIDATIGVISFIIFRSKLSSIIKMIYIAVPIVAMLMSMWLFVTH